MISLFFFGIGGFFGWWFRGTKAGSWLKKQFSKDPTV